MLDIKNRNDHDAVSLRTDDPTAMLGYVPRYIAKDARNLLNSSYENFSIKVERLNLDAPIKYRVLCKMISKWPEAFSACSDEDFKVI